MAKYHVLNRDIPFTVEAEKLKFDPNSGTYVLVDADNSIVAAFPTTTPCYQVDKKV